MLNLLRNTKKQIEFLRGKMNLQQFENEKKRERQRYFLNEFK